ncbi:hypothetical protein HPB47_024283 [Ixodes persulcatus]|uniref:Uncharacterized protein n=1 Tax=Ixodes persulcatus TaxID=34615 RepID=A0AC60Q4P6_IXOPE|nr:hypothetical protein HPB47_024283 [Ixodes persulcatus]
MRGTVFGLTQHALLSTHRAPRRMDKASGPDAPQQIDEPAVSNDDKQESQAKPANSEASSVAGLEPSNDDVSPLAAAKLSGAIPKSDSAASRDTKTSVSSRDHQSTIQTVSTAHLSSEGKPTVSEKTDKEKDNEEAQERRLSESKLDFEEKGRLEAGKAEKPDSVTGEKADTPEKTKKEPDSPPLEHHETATKDNKSEEAKFASNKTESDQTEGGKAEQYDKEKGLEEKDEKDEKYAKEVDVKESGENEEQKHELGKNLVSTSPGGSEHSEPESRDNQNESRKKEDTSDRSKDPASPQPDKNGHADASPSNKEVESAEEKETAQDVLKEDKASKDVREEEKPANVSRVVTGDEETQGTASAHDAPTMGKLEEANKVEEEETSKAKGVAEASRTSHWWIQLNHSKLRHPKMK